MRVFAALSGLPAVFLSIYAVSAFASAPVASKAADPSLPPPLEALSKQGAEIRYLGREAGLDGWVTIKDGQEQYFYVTPDQQAILLGVLFNNKGDIVTMRQIDALRKKDPSLDALTGATPDTAPPATPAPESAAAAPALTSSTPQSGTQTAAPAQTGQSKSQKLFAEVEAASWITVGQKNAPAIYSFIDPQCPHCHDMIDDFRKSGFLDKGQVQLRLIPVGLMNEMSLKQAANLVAAENPALQLFKHLGGDTEALMADPNPNTQSIQRNMALMQSWKLDVTPFSVYKNKAGQIKIIRGRPEDLKALVAELK